MRPKIYIAGPYSSDPYKGIVTAVKVAEELFNAGFTPFVPHLCHLWGILYKHSPEEWLSYGKEWLWLCDALVRIDGDSEGADVEVHQATEIGIPVFRTVEEVIDFYGMEEKAYGSK